MKKNSITDIAERACDIAEDAKELLDIWDNALNLACYDYFCMLFERKPSSDDELLNFKQEYLLAGEKIVRKKGR